MPVVAHHTEDLQQKKKKKKKDLQLTLGSIDTLTSQSVCISQGKATLAWATQFWMLLSNPGENPSNNFLHICGWVPSTGVSSEESPKSTHINFMLVFFLLPFTPFELET